MGYTFGVSVSLLTKSPWLILLCVHDHIAIDRKWPIEVRSQACDCVVALMREFYGMQGFPGKESNDESLLEWREGK